MNDDDLMARARAYLDDPRANLTDEQRAAADKRRAILGSSEDTRALNRHERGSARIDGLWLGLIVGLIAFSVLSAIEPRVLWALAAVLAYLLLAVPAGIWVSKLIEGKR